MRGHGAVVVANSIPNVVGRSIYLDINARAQLQAVTLGGRLTLWRTAFSATFMTPSCTKAV